MVSNFLNKFNLLIMKNLSKEEMKMVIGGRFMAYTCICSGGNGSEWFYNGGDRPSQNTIDRDISNYCSSGTGSCIYKAYGGDMPEL